MNVFRHFADRVAAAVVALQAEGALPSPLDLRAVSVEPPRDPAHGDLATNAAMVLARGAGRKPRDLAELLTAKLRAEEHVVEVSIAGPGFINLRLDDGFWRERLADALAAGPSYGDSAMGAGRKVNVEYVSANPTGPLTVGHARGAIFGDVLASLLAKAGWDVTREYYVNDAGAQVDTLARSAYLRYREANGAAIGEIPVGLYPGEYLKDVGAALATRDGAKWMDAPEAEWLPVVRPFAVAELMAVIRGDLESLGIHMDVYTSERALVDAGAVEKAFETLKGAGLIYVGRLPPPKGEKPDDWEDRDQTLFRSTQFGDDVDRPMKKSDGSWTYFANDIANHLDKYRRGFAYMIDVWGADHGGYVKRMQSAVKAITDGRGRLDIELCQIVRLMRRGELVRMSKRSGNFVTLRDLVEEAGAGVARFLILTRENKTPFDFDLEKALEQSKDNMVWYVQYAHARTCSVMRQAAEGGVRPTDALRALATVEGASSLDALLAAARPHFGRLTDAGELGLIRLIAAWPRQVELAAEHREPHRLAFYLYELASQFHAHWNRGKDDPSLRFIVDGDEGATLARLALVKGAGVVIQSGLAVFGVPAMQELR